MTSWSGWARPKGTAQVVRGRTGNDGFEVEGHGTDECRPFRRSPEPIDRRAVLMIPVIAVVEGGTQLRRGQGVLVASGSDDIGSRFEDPRQLLPFGDRIHGRRAPGERGDHRRGRVGAKEAGATQGKVIQVR